ncbi:hypothetical protein C5B42_01790 [Candidatus Cerribacteria bacterium 'Amazon FNV 2010 28 9']|uniref:Uncharacterized protein n=1 Tax=Candidatus Cerribacteria bacterium 'Amazon FNV 2010 28 9' TaxID=2081795 RepID=A0A317JQQ4_9BACT|nr:MAG: hypothetical protein C5B42_01790 [Candidatus Cerribacteria bacterium 'Amazon FNV 2010 28 9']
MQKWDTLEIHVWWNTKTPRFARDEEGDHEGPWGQVASRANSTAYDFNDDTIPCSGVSVPILMEKIKQEGWEPVSVVDGHANPDATQREHGEVISIMFFKRPVKEG